MSGNSNKQTNGFYIFKDIDFQWEKRTFLFTLSCFVCKNFIFKEFKNKKKSWSEFNTL